MRPQELLKDLPTEIGRIMKTLVEHDVKFVLCGGAACMLHGVHGRVTGDVDICVQLESANLSRFVAAGRELQLRPRIPEPLEAIADPARRQDWIDRKLAVVSSYSSPELILQVDVFLRYPIPFDELVASADRMRRVGLEFLISSKQHLIAAKQRVKPLRKIDQRDIADLQELIDREQQTKR